MGADAELFDVAARYAGLDAKKDPLLKIDEAVSCHSRFAGVWSRCGASP